MDFGALSFKEKLFDSARLPPSDEERDYRNVVQGGGMEGSVHKGPGLLVIRPHGLFRKEQNRAALLAQDVVDRRGEFFHRAKVRA